MLVEGYGWFCGAGCMVVNIRVERSENGNRGMVVVKQINVN